MAIASVIRPLTEAYVANHGLAMEDIAKRIAIVLAVGTAHWRLAAVMYAYLQNPYARTDKCD
jgi:fermentation-respiration switch protein FrsA (DUF1100 family)